MSKAAKSLDASKARQARLAWPDLAAHNRHLRREILESNHAVNGLYSFLGVPEMLKRASSVNLVAAIRSMPVRLQNEVLLTEYMRLRRQVKHLERRKAAQENFENFKKGNI